MMPKSNDSIPYYTTHELGPIAKVLNINRGNRMVTLSSFSSKSRGMNAYIKENKDKYPHLADSAFKQGDMISKGGSPVAIPDFTGGKWLLDKKEDIELDFSLD